jgi:broad specificity phosphatase PhoE
MEKTLYCIRHGFALHNKLFGYIGKKAYTDFRDTPLLHEGILEAKHLGDTWEHIDDIELVIISPCLRTLDTATRIFDKSYPMVALDCLIEYPMGHDICNKRKNIDDLKFLFHWVNFKEIKNNELEWPHEKETLDQLDARINTMKQWISKRPEKKIALVGHSSFIKRCMDRPIGDESDELLHCYPYEIAI